VRALRIGSALAFAPTVALVVVTACGSFGGDPVPDAGAEGSTSEAAPLESSIEDDGGRAPPECPLEVSFCDTFERSGDVRGQWTFFDTSNGTSTLLLDPATSWSGTSSLGGHGIAGSAAVRLGLKPEAPLAISFYLRVEKLPVGGSILAQFGMQNGTAVSFVVEDRGLKISEQNLLADGPNGYADEPPVAFPWGRWVRYDFRVVGNVATIEAASESLKVTHNLSNPIALNKSVSVGIVYVAKQPGPGFKVWFDDVIVR
jgi:hypothetical protein